MSATEIILTILGLIVFLGLLLWAMIKIRIEGCKHCPHRKECDKGFESSDDFVPKCFQCQDPLHNFFN